MGPRSKFALWVWICCMLFAGLMALAGAALWADLNDEERRALAALLQPRVTLFSALALLLPFVVGAALRSWFKAYPQAATRLAEELRLIHTVNPAHRVAAEGGAEMRQLAQAVNAFAQTHATLRSEVETRIALSGAHLLQEKNRLAALMSELAQSVLVCNGEGRVLLYNAQAAALLAPGGAASGASPVGLGRSIFSILDKGAIVHALEQVSRRVEQQVPHAVAHFVTLRDGQLLRAKMAPVLGAERKLDGFVLVIEDITRAVEADGRRDQLLRQLTEGTRAPLANIRAAAETIEQYPEMDAGHRERFTAVILDEAERLSSRLNESAAVAADSLAYWPLEDMLAGDLAFALQRNFRSSIGVAAHVREPQQSLWLNVDSHALVQALTHVMGNIASVHRARHVELDIAATAAGRHVRLSLRWKGPALAPEVLRAWELQPSSIEQPGATLKDVLARHGGEWWCRADPARGENQLCVQLPTVQPGHVEPAAAAPLPQRPVYYDFDLFNQPGQTPELDERLLSELAYTVFDTETTGLSPSEGDEIISIGAVRIVNGRLLQHETFEQLVDPRRPVRAESQRVHGISSEMLRGQPGIEQVLPAFHRFAEDTVLVAHNAAFDMRFLQLKEAQTGVSFVQPVLDTLMLSALVHPGHADAEHRLEEIARRLGVEVVGRHTALGDAMVTGEVFLKLVPLLAERGIRTLGQAREASRKTVYAKLDY
jgi:DNA polymerase-3 subunit epsilon